MTLKEKLQVAWDNRAQIAEGFYNAYLSHDPEIKAETARRVAICESNVCGHYDSTGQTEKVVLKGKPACALCGCNIPAKPALMWVDCSLKEHGGIPLWEAITTNEMDKEVAQKQWEAQFKNKQ